MSKRPVKKLSELDPESPEYWEVVLKDHGLSVNRGRNTSRLSYVGGTEDLGQIESVQAADLTCGDGRKVRPRGAKPE